MKVYIVIAYNSNNGNIASIWDDYFLDKESAELAVDKLTTNENFAMIQELNNYHKKDGVNNESL